jgi:poly [ADP-ribose] polymerase 10/14/15
MVGVSSSEQQLTISWWNQLQSNFLLTGTAYGNGVYFAVNAGYSIGYCGTGDHLGNMHMFSVQVLTGDACQGRSGMSVLPTKPGNGLMTHDSASDNPSNPVMFVIFHDSQAYPTYHILFK